MAAREEFKAVEIAGRRWKIGKFDAQTGSYIAYQLLVQALPMGIPGLPQIGGNRPLMPKADFFALQRDCLSVCFEMTNVGGNPVDMPVLMQDGRWAVDGLEKDTALVLTLTGQALAFNVASFFEQMGLIFPGMMEQIAALNSSASGSPGETTAMPQ